MHPAKLLLILGTLGIDAHKEFDVAEMGPGEEGGRYYSVSYRDPGDRMTTLSSDRHEGPTWDISFSNTPTAEKPETIAHLEIWVELPWRLNEVPTVQL